MATQSAFRSGGWSRAVEASSELLTKVERDRFGHSEPQDIIRDFEGRLILARDCELYFSKLLDMLYDIGDAIPGFYVYEQLFSTHAGLRETLVAKYCDVIAFLIKAKRVFSSGSFRLFGQVT